MTAGTGGAAAIWRRRGELAPPLAVGLLAATYSVGALRAFPIWDDGWLALLLAEQGVDGIVPSHPERPAVVALWRLLAWSPEAFWRWAFAAQIVLWPLLAWLAARLWTTLEPRRKALAPLVGFLTIAPFVTRVQMVTASVALASLLSVVLATAGIHCLLRFVLAGGRGRLAAAAALVAAGVLLQEYAVPVALGGGILALAYGEREPAARRRRWTGAAALVAVTALSYLLYLRLADFAAAAARDELDPRHFLARDDLWRELPSALLTSVWWGMAGGIGEAARDVDGALRQSPFALAWGLLLGALLAWGCSPPPAGEARARSRWPLVALAAALVAALTPPAVAGEVPWSAGDAMSSRFGLPAKPFLAMLVGLLLSRLLPARLLAVPVAAIGFLGGVEAASDVREAVAERREVEAKGDCLRPWLESSAGVTVVVLPSEERELGPVRQWELTARLAEGYPPELSRRLWAFRHGGGPPLFYRDQAEQIFGPRESCRRPGRLERRVRNLERRGRIESLLWIEQTPEGEIVIEPYCRARGAEPRVLVRCTATTAP